MALCLSGYTFSQPHFETLAGPCQLKFRYKHLMLCFKKVNQEVVLIELNNLGTKVGLCV